jgi:phycocyanobilin lyase subunit beta
MTNTALAQKLIHAVEQADSSAGLLEAVQNLAAVRLEEAIPTLIAALGYNNPGAAVAAVDGLVLIGKPVVKPLLELIDDYNYGARAWAVRALAGIGDPRALGTLLEAAKTDFSLSVRRAAARGLGTLRWNELPEDKIRTAQVQALDTLLIVSQDTEWVVRYAAVTGLEALAIALAETQPDLVPKVIAKLETIVQGDGEVAVRTRVRMAQQQLQEEFLMNKELTQESGESEAEEAELPHRGGGRR